jgi:polysaccharide chain length determinant protein (PEP-CTERM system associated)
MVPGRRYTPRYLAGVLRRRWPLVVVPLVIVTSLAVLLARALPDVYYSQATVLIVPQQIPESYVRTTVTVPIAERLRATTQEIKSPATLAPLMDEFGLYTNLRRTVPGDALVAWMARNIRIDQVRGDTLVIGFSGYEAGSVAKVTDRLVHLFIDGTLRNREVLADSASKFLDTELESTRKRLEEQERRVQEFRERHAGELPTQVSANLQILQGGEAQLQAVTEDLRQDRDRRTQLQEVIAREQAEGEKVSNASPPLTDEIPPPAAAPAGSGAAGTADDPLALPAGPVQQRLAAARALLQQLLKKYTPEYPDVARLQATIAELEKTAAETRPSPGPSKAARPAVPAASPRLQTAQAELRRLDQRIAEKEALQQRLRDGIATYQARIEAVPGRESEWTALTRDYQTIQQSYTSLLAKKEESRLAANLERQRISEQFRVISPAVTPSRPSSPNRPGIVLIGILLGLACGLGVPVLLELTDSTLRGEKEVLATLRLPVIAMIPRMVTAADRRRRQRRLLRTGVAAAVLAVVAAAWRWR